MKIGIYDPYLDTLSGGEKYMLTIASYLSAYHSVDIFWDISQADSIKNNAKQKFVIDINNVSFVENIFSKDITVVKRMFISKKYDVIFYLSDGSIPLIFPRKLIIHFQFPVDWVSRTIKTRIKLLNVSSIICNSFFTKQRIDRKFSINSIVVYPPVDIPFQENRPVVKKENLILTVGRLEKLPNGTTFKKHEVLIDQFRKFSKSHFKNWNLYIVTSFQKQNEKDIRILEEQSRGFPIKILKNITKKQLDELYGKAKIYWHAAGFGEDLDKYPNRAEHFGISTVEAMGAHAVPVVANFGGQKEIVEDNRDGFLWENTDELIKKTEYIINHPESWKEISNRASKKAKLFSKKRFCDSIEKIIT